MKNNKVRLPQDKKKRLHKTKREALEPASIPVDRQFRGDKINSVLAAIDVDDPYAEKKGDKIRVTRSLRDDPVGAMHNSGHISDDVYEASKRWYGLFIKKELGNLRAMDLTRPKVDGGRMVEFESVTRDEARQTLMQIDAELGREGAAWVHDVLGMGMCIRDAAAKRGLFSQLEIKFAGARLRECLTTIAVILGHVKRSELPDIPRH